ncbi:MAG: ATP-binding protein [Limnospira sp.]
MPVRSVNILLIEDDLAAARLLQELLKCSALDSFQLVHVKRLREALKTLKTAELESQTYDVILLDLTLPDSSGLDSLTPLLYQAPSLPIIVLTNTNDDKLAIEAVRQGAQDYLVKRMVNAEVLVRSIRYAIERKQAFESLKEMNETLEDQVKAKTEQLLQAQELNQLKAEFVSMMSHDFRNPLSTILLSTELLRDSAEKLSPEQKLRLFQRIRAAGQNMTQLLDEVLFMGQSDLNELQCFPVPLNVESFCRQIVDEIQLEVGEKYEIIFESQGVFQSALWDDNLLRHILNNLLNNAIKYSPEGSTIWFDMLGREDAVIFQVQDQGVGIPPRDLSKVFQPFYRSENVGKVPGNGLGLAIVKRCVETHGGRISVDSQLDVGTTFTVAIPVTTVAFSEVSSGGTADGQK